MGMHRLMSAAHAAGYAMAAPEDVPAPEAVEAPQADAQRTSTSGLSVVEAVRSLSAGAAARSAFVRDWIMTRWAGRATA